MKKRIITVLIAVCAIIPLKGWGQPLSEERDSIANYLTEIVRQQTASPRVKIDSVAVEKKTVKLFASVGLSYADFDKALVDEIYDKVKEMLPEDQRKKRLEIYSDRYKIEDYIPLVRKEKFDFSVKTPLKRNISLPVSASKGLQNKHIAMWQSHGWYYEKKLGRWEWQRARIFQTVEDLFTQSFVLPYLVPMLENAGANVLLPRERDTRRAEITVDNDYLRDGSLYYEFQGQEKWITGENQGFAHIKDVYVYGENPFRDGTYRQTKTIKKGVESLVEWKPEIPEKGDYAVYISYASVKNSAEDAHYTVYHTGGKTEFSINQTMGGGTWIFLGFFNFDKGVNENGRIALSNISAKKGKILTADGVKIGGGMGNIARGEPLETSAYPRYTEGSRYWLQWAGMPDSIYSWTKNETDYTDDYQSRGLWVNYLAGGSKINPQKDGLNIPIDLSFAFHTDAGTTYNDSIIGTLGICMTHHNDEKFASGKPRILSRDLVATVMSEITDMIRADFEPQWTKRQIWNRSYSEARLPEAPTMLLELLSHQNFADMKYGLDPRFRFAVSRAIYKGMLKFLACQNKAEYKVQPLPVQDFGLQFAGEDRIVLSWSPSTKEPDATPTGYIVYTALGDNDFDNGTVTNDRQLELKIEKDKIFRYKVVAFNEGGLSFPSETLSASRVSNEKGLALAVNGFTRISAPDNFASSDSIAGFLDYRDHGVPDRKEYNYIGSQFEYRRSIPWMDDDAAGFGASNANYETTVVAGNTFDYPYLYGKSLTAAGYSFVSASAGSVENGQTDLNKYRFVALILGKQKEIETGRQGAMPPLFKTFPAELQEKITDYCGKGGNIFVSGAYVGTDLWDSRFASSADRKFAQDVLKYKWRTGHAAVTGKVKSVASPYASLQGRYEFLQSPNSEFYAVESPDAVEPVEGGSTVFRYAENNLSAGVAWSGEYKTLVLGFPFEAVREQALRDELMKNIIEFME
ncbi:MAG: xanthan lyase [Dysgonamonadaceae bacterium]|nr:xanthan lyase [Dysgonamonadaceae bacterium]